MFGASLESRELVQRLFWPFGHTPPSACKMQGIAHSSQEQQVTPLRCCRCSCTVADDGSQVVLTKKDKTWPYPLDMLPATQLWQGLTTRGSAAGTSGRTALWQQWPDGTHSTSRCSFGSTVQRRELNSPIPNLVCAAASYGRPFRRGPQELPKEIAVSYESRDDVLIPAPPNGQKTLKINVDLMLVRLQKIALLS